MDIRNQAYKRSINYGATCGERSQAEVETGIENMEWDRENCNDDTPWKLAVRQFGDEFQSLRFSWEHHSATYQNSAWAEQIARSKGMQVLIVLREILVEKGARPEDLDAAGQAVVTWKGIRKETPQRGGGPGQGRGAGRGQRGGSPGGAGRGQRGGSPGKGGNMRQGGQRGQWGQGSQGSRGGGGGARPWRSYGSGKM